MAYPRAEQETVLVYSEESRTWTAYSCVPRHMRKLAEIATVEPVDTAQDGEFLAVRATLTDKQVRMVAPRVLTEEQREALRARAAKLRENQREDADENDE
jgi:hypothetical protein